MSYQGGKWQDSVVGPEGEILLAESGGEKSERSVAAEVVLLNRFVRREWAEDVSPDSVEDLLGLDHDNSPVDLRDWGGGEPAERHELWLDEHIAISGIDVEPMNRENIFTFGEAINLIADIKVNEFDDIVVTTRLEC